MQEQTHKISLPIKRRISACLLVSGILLIVLIVVGITVPALITSQAEEIYGPPAPGIGNTQRIYLSALLLFQSRDMTQPTNPEVADVELTINQGESIASITGKLWEKGLIPNPGVFRNYLQYTGLDTSIKAGDYRLSAKMTPIEIAKAIQSSISAEVTLTILPGWRLEEVANALPSSGLTITPEEFILATKSHPQGYSFTTCMNESSLEGYLFPGSYTVPRETTINELLPQILMNFEAHVTNELKNGFTNQGLNLCQAVTLASIIQREAVIEDEMPMIASVFFNRLNNGSVLESDPTVQYAIGFNQEQGTWWTNPLSMKDLKTNSPYNTYQNPGLPPGPISNPSLEALQAVAFPAQTTYYYFRSACDGSGRHSFAETFDEHVSNECP